MFTVADDNLGNTDLARPAECLMQNCVGFFPTLSRLQEIWSVEELRIDLFQVNEVGDVNGMRRLDSHFFKVLILHHNIIAALIFEAFYDLIGGDFLRVGLRDLFISVLAEIAGTKMPEAYVFLPGRRRKRHRKVKQSAADAPLPPRAPMG